MVYRAANALVKRFDPGTTAGTGCMLQVATRISTFACDVCRFWVAHARALRRIGSKMGFPCAREANFLFWRRDANELFARCQTRRTQPITKLRVSEDLEIAVGGTGASAQTIHRNCR